MRYGEKLNEPVTAWMEDGFRPHDRTSRNFGSQRVALFIDPEVTSFRQGRFKGVGRFFIRVRLEQLAFSAGASEFLCCRCWRGNFDFYKKLGYGDAELAPFYDLHQTVVKKLDMNVFSR